MTAEQELAANRIVLGFLLADGSIGVSVAGYGPRTGRGMPTDTARRAYESDEARCFQEWVRECRRTRLHAADVIGYPR